MVCTRWCSIISPFEIASSPLYRLGQQMGQQMETGVEYRIMPNDSDGRWYWEVIKDGHEVVARGVADTEPVACEQANEAARKAKLID
jgi:hypothetical protein